MAVSVMWLLLEKTAERLSENNDTWGPSGCRALSNSTDTLSSEIVFEKNYSEPAAAHQEPLISDNGLQIPCLLI